ncbi:PfkB family carbohydrate kinase [Solirhodobacter olei]|uniref:PfkB family carbohydrate kinase n=1 Tax=Solirhodobacter olei TaxID=2493082 RepID=UPI000FD8A083
MRPRRRICSSDGRSFEIPAEPVDVVSTHGAGDTFTGQFAASLLFGNSFEDCCREATRAAAQHVAGSGPSPSG